MATPMEPTLTAFSSNEPRRWVQIPPVANGHPEATRGMMLLASQGVTPGNAIVLGAGSCLDLPLNELATRFREVRLIDRDDAMPEHARLAVEHATKVHRQVADLTGVSAEFLRRVNAILGMDAGPQDATESLARLADETVPRVWTAGQRFDLVIASCVLSQLHTEACNHAVEQFAARFPDHLTAFRSATRWVDAMFGLARRMEAAFLETLQGLLKPDGRIYLADSVQGCFIHPAPDGHWMTDGMYRITRTLELADELGPQFRVEDQGRWVWVIPPLPGGGQVGRLFKVQGLILSTNTNSKS